MMKSNYRRRSNKSTTQKAIGIELKQAQLLRSIDERLLQQQTSAEPNVRDVVLPRLKRDKVYTFCQTVVGFPLASSTTVEVDNSFYFTLGALANATPFETLFDTYRIIGVVVKFFPKNSNVSGTVYAPPLYMAIDYDDNSSTTLSTLQGYETLKIAPSGSYFERSLVPRISLAAYSGAFTSYAQATMQWLDCASPNILHFGLKYAFPVGTAVSYYDVSYTVTIQFRNTR